MYSTNEKEHTKQVLKVLKQLWDHGMQVDVNKCKFSVIQMKYLDLIITFISTDGISIDLKKV